MGFEKPCLLQQFSRNRRSQHGLRLIAPGAAAQPPERPLLDRPFRFLTGQQKCRQSPEHRLVTDCQHSAAGIRPAACRNQIGNSGIGPDREYGLERL